MLRAREQPQQHDLGRGAEATKSSDDFFDAEEEPDDLLPEGDMDLVEVPDGEYHIEQGVLGGCLAIALLGAWSQFGAAGEGKETAVAVVYFVVQLLTALAVAPALRRIWRGGDGDSEGEDVDNETTLAAASAHTTGVTTKKVVV